MKKKSIARRVWHFLWEEDSLLSWLFNILIAFIVIKFLVYPGLGLALGTTHPIVAVVSGSMEHDGTFDGWWDLQKDLYLKMGITKAEFQGFRFRNGFNTGDIMILHGKMIEDVKPGDVLVYLGTRRPDPIIHRVVEIGHDDDGIWFRTKGDHNLGSNPDEYEIRPERVIGYAKYGKASVALVRIPYLGYLKMGAVWLVNKMFGVW